MDFKHKKKLGQNFISDKNLLSAIVNDARVKETDNILEIGVGKAGLTKELALKAKKVIAFELDKDLKPIIDKELSGFSNAQIQYNDILNVENKKIRKLFNDEKFKIVANLPYYITSPIIFKFLDDPKNLSEMILMVQKEVGERFSSKYMDSNYSASSAKAQLRSEIKQIRNINKKMFKPSPDVDSVLVKFDIKNKLNNDNYKEIKDFIDKAFLHRRKTFFNNIKSGFFIDKNKLISIFNKLEIPLNTRPQEISPEGFVLLFNLLKNEQWCFY